MRHAPATKPDKRTKATDRSDLDRILRSAAFAVSSPLTLRAVARTNQAIADSGRRGATITSLG